MVARPGDRDRRVRRGQAAARLRASAQDGVKGFWVLTGLRSSSGALVPVVRGFVPASAASVGALAPPTGTGRAGRRARATRPGARRRRRAERAGRADPGGRHRRRRQPVGQPDLQRAALRRVGRERPLQPVPAPPANQGGGLDLLNAAYAVQWWLFGVFALLLWWRMVRQDAGRPPTAGGAGRPHRTAARRTARTTEPRSSAPRDRTRSRPPPAGVPRRSAESGGALLRYRFMAFFTGVMLIILTFVAIPVQIWGHNDVLVHIFGFIHGWGFLVYLVTVGRPRAAAALEPAAHRPGGHRRHRAVLLVHRRAPGDEADPGRAGRAARA